MNLSSSLQTKRDLGRGNLDFSVCKEGFEEGGGNKPMNCFQANCINYSPGEKIFVYLFYLQTYVFLENLIMIIDKWVY